MLWVVYVPTSPCLLALLGSGSSCCEEETSLLLEEMVGSSRNIVWPTSVGMHMARICSRRRGAAR